MTEPSMPSAVCARESLRVGGGFGAAAAGASPAGGLDVDDAGNLATDGDVTVAGVIDARGGVVNTAGALVLDAPDDSADSTIYLENSDSAYGCHVDVDGTLEVDNELTVQRADTVNGIFMRMESTAASGYGVRMRHPEANKKPMHVANLYTSGSSSSGEGRIDFKVGSESSPTTAMKIEDDGDVWMAGDCSALSFTDRSPVFLGDALAALAKIGARAGSEQADGWAEVDHESLPAGVGVVRERRAYRVREDGRVRAPDEVEAMMGERLLPSRREADGTACLLDQATGEAYDTEADWLVAHFEAATQREDRRDIGAQIQVNLRAIMQLLARVEALEAQLAAR